VTFDIDRYGDKELKVATTNKLRQNIGDVLLSAPQLAPEFLRLMLADSCLYDAEDKTGGPEGSILEHYGEVKSLTPNALRAISELNGVKKKLQRFEISAGDILSFR